MVVVKREGGCPEKESERAGGQIPGESPSASPSTSCAGLRAAAVFAGIPDMWIYNTGVKTSTYCFRSLSGQPL